MQQKIGDTMGGTIALARAGAAQTNRDAMRAVRIESRLIVEQTRLIGTRLPSVERMRADLPQLASVRDTRLVARAVGFGLQIIAGKPNRLRVRRRKSLL